MIKTRRESELVPPSTNSNTLRHAAWVLPASGLGFLVFVLLMNSWIAETARLWHVYLFALCFFTSIALGALFFVILQHLIGARWSGRNRRLAEILTVSFPVLLVLFSPLLISVLMGSSSLYHWNDVSMSASDPLISAKESYLNGPFFVVRTAAYFAVWILISRFYLYKSIEQDGTGSDQPTRQLRWYSGPAMLAFAATVNFASVDWLMSLDPHWFSTTFGVYFFAGCVVALFSVMPVLALITHRTGRLVSLSLDQLHDMAKLQYGFMMFWAYIAYSQYVLIWYANIPEETSWLAVRQKSPWLYLSVLLVVGHFVVPFCFMMSRTARRSRRMLAAFSIWLLMMHAVDLYWVVMPNLSEQYLSPSVSTTLVELLCVVGVALIWLGTLMGSLDRIPIEAPHRLVPVPNRNTDPEED